ncbi:MFS transporter [Billgrantia pellis]|uniref:MFS transporter n=1 Tax=Billgrantia pellis TaxID=2606936 RepID=A0A7V7G1Z2_9GAMM|nr:MFS transporter [Halomonas pellis]KAA0013800.1 MFS transporter [Halomonas pellis]
MHTPNRSPIYLIALGAFALGMASYVTAGLIPMIEASFTVSVAVAAQLVTAFTLAYGLGSPIVVALTPANRQRTGLLLSLGLFVIANAASALVDNFTALMAWRAIAGMGAGVYLAMGIGASAAVSTPEHRGKAIAIIMGGMASGVVLGVPLGLFIAEQMGWQSALWLVAILGVMAFIGLLLRLPPLPAATASSLGQKLAILSDGHVLVILTVSLFAAIASLGMYTFIAPLLTDPAYGAVRSVTPYLWVWGIGGVLGSFLIGPLVDRLKGPNLTFAIMVVLAVSLFVLPLSAALSTWLVMLPIALWGAVGWALQVPQNNELLRARQTQGDGNLAIALNESALYLGSAIGAAAGGFVLLLQLPVWTLAICAAGVAALGALLQIVNLRRQPTLGGETQANKSTTPNEANANAPCPATQCAQPGYVDGRNDGITRTARLP